MDSYLRSLAKSLYERRHLAAQVPVEDRADDQFAPIRGDCHVNVDKWCRLHPGHRPVRGWLVIEMIPFRRFHFIAHSVVKDLAGRRFDVTPQQAFTKHPFIEDEDIEEVYLLRAAYRKLVAIDHFL